MPDRIAALVQYLQAQSAVTALTGQRVYAEEIPDSVIARMPMPCLVILAAGGTQSIGHGYSDYSDWRVDVRHYGYSPNTARDLFNVVYSTLKNMQRTSIGGTLLHWANPAGGPHQMRDPPVGWPSTNPDATTHWPFVVASWQVLAADVPVPVIP